jgi:double-strand break repair protein MRE11
MQPGSSVATSLCPGEAVEKQIAILSITGREFKTESIRLKTVRPFIMKEIVLLEEKGLAAIAKKRDNRNDVSRYLVNIVEGMIQEALDEWLEGQDSPNETIKAPLPLVRLRVEYSAPESGNFEIENPQRFSNRFIGKVANVHDVIQFHRKKTSGGSMFKSFFKSNFSRGHIRKRGCSRQLDNG